MAPQCKPRSRSEAIVFFAALLYGAILLAPIYCQPIFAMLDSSWGYGINYLIHTNLKFGPDYIHAYGPLGFISVPLHVANNIQIALVVRFIVWGTGFWQLGRMWLAGNRTGAWLFIAALVAGRFVYLSYWEHLAKAVILILYIRQMTEKIAPGRMAMIAMLTGMLFLVKFSSFVLALIALFIYTLHFAYFQAKTARRWEYVGLGLAWISSPVAYLLYEPSLFHLFDYIRGELSTASGYVTSMSLDTDPHNATIGTVICGILLAGMCTAPLFRAIPWSGAFLIAALTWSSFRQGYSRSDARHNAIFCFLAPLFLAGLIALVQMTVARRWMSIAFFTTMLAVCMPLANAGWGSRYQDFWSPRLNLFQGLSIFQWTETMQYLDNLFKASVASTPIELYRPRLAGQRVLMVSWDLAYAAQSNFELFPLYGFQNYSAYTHFLDEESARKLSEAKPPVRYVVFEWKTIDGRNLVTDDPVLWTTLLSEYAPVRIDRKSALLERRDAALKINYPPLSQVPYHREVWVNVPQKQTPVAVRIELKPSLKASFTSAAYKLDGIYMEAKTRGGTVHIFKVPPDVIRSPFVINWLPFSLDEAMAEWSGDGLPDPIQQIRLMGEELCFFSAPGWNFPM